MVGNDNFNPIKSISIYIRYPLVVALEHPTPKVTKERRKTLCWRQLSSIIRNQSDTSALSWFPPAALHYMSQAIIRAHRYNIAIYNRTEEACCADSGASEDMLPDYSTFRTYHHLHNRYSTLGDTTRLPIEGNGTAVYTLNGKTILTRNALHISALRGPIYYLRKHCQRPGCGVY